jgi:hypothetical protein
MKVSWRCNAFDPVAGLELQRACWEVRAVRWLCSVVLCCVVLLPCAVLCFHVLGFFALLVTSE